MGVISEKTSYVLVGCHYPIEIENCSEGAIDIYHLEALVLDLEHSINRSYLTTKLSLPSNWDFNDILEVIIRG